MHGSVKLVSRLSIAVVLILLVSSVAVAGPEECDPPTHDPSAPPAGLVDAGCSVPVPVPEGEPDDYMDRSESRARAVVVWVVHTAGIFGFGWLAR